MSSSARLFTFDASAADYEITLCNNMYGLVYCTVPLCGECGQENEMEVRMLAGIPSFMCSAHASSHDAVARMKVVHRRVVKGKSGWRRGVVVKPVRV